MSLSMTPRLEMPGVGRLFTGQHRTSLHVCTSRTLPTLNLVVNGLAMRQLACSTDIISAISRDGVCPERRQLAPTTRKLGVRRGQVRRVTAGPASFLLHLKSRGPSVLPSMVTITHNHEYASADCLLHAFSWLRPYCADVVIFLFG